MQKKLASLRRGGIAAKIIAESIVILLVLTIMVLSLSPALAAQGSDQLRSVIGDEAVSQLESVVFQIQDTVKQWRFDLGLAPPSAPWQVILNPGATKPSTTSTRSIPTLTPVPASTDRLPSPQTTVTSEPSPTPTMWMPNPATPLGSLEGEGVWSAYIQDSSGQTIAYRTYLQPDPSRPYAILGVVAFDTNRTRLHFVLGSAEPYAPDSPKRTGQMPAEDKVPGVLIAMFNGGFKARHGHFGAMANGLIALPPRNGLGTIAIYNDGRLQLGEWGSDLSGSPDMLAWRQNGPLVVNAGQINPRIYNNSPDDWGYTIKDVSPTWRSGIGLSADGNTFYYLCGSSLSMEMLAKSMLAAGILNGIQLDINNYWVHFVAVRENGIKFSLEPLFPDMMFENIDRYLYAYSRDYFYITLAR